MELLSPAGSFESLKAAVNYGADAVYVGGSRYSARSSAQNFNDEELLSAVEYCHLRGVKLYVCTNTLLQESELSQAMDFVRYAYKIGVDALIVQDLGLIRRIRQELPDFPLHGSTQMTVLNHQGVNTLAELGLERVVLAREVTEQGLRSITEKTKTELEYFVHGALCISYSGQCLMSSILGGRSGNRGGCAQPCRLPYTLLKNGKPASETLPLMCPKDLCLAGDVQTLAKMGITSLKIEGRMKSPEYVAMVTQVYRQALSGTVTETDIQNMLKFFSRGGSCRGYFDGPKYGEMMDIKDKPKIAGSLPELVQKQKVSPVALSLSAQVGEPLALTIAYGDETVSVSGAVCEKAHTKATDKERMEQQIAKLGGTPFYAASVSVITCGQAAVPVSALNELRRQAVADLEDAICAKYCRALPKQTPAELPARSEKPQPKLSAEVMTKEQLSAAKEMGIERVYVPHQLLSKVEGIPEVFTLLPPISREGEPILAEGDKICIQNIGQLSSCRGKSLAAGHRLNVTNSESVAFLQENGINCVTLSPELNLKQMARLCRRTVGDLEVIAYGRLPLMLTENCVIKSTLGRCECDKASFSLRDRKNEIFPVHPLRCGNVIYNSKPIYMADRMNELTVLPVRYVKLCFTTEKFAETKQVLTEYQKAMAGKEVKAPDGGYTRGHFYRGVQ